MQHVAHVGFGFAQLTETEDVTHLVFQVMNGTEM